MKSQSKTLRGWQETCYQEFKRVMTEGRKSFLAVAGVGSGKTFFSSYVFDQLQKNGNFNSVVIVSPTENIKRNWSYTFQKEFDIKVDHGYTFKHGWPRDCHGVSLTYQSLTDNNVQILSRYINGNVLLIVDEVHHAGDTKAWGEAIQEIGDKAGFVLLLSGTPKRGDNSKIPFVTYKRIDKTKDESDSKPKVYELQTDYYYGYAESIKDKVCCPTIFPKNPSKVKTLQGYDTLQYAEDDPPNRQLFNQVISVKNSPDDCYVYLTFQKANKQLSELNDKRNGNYAGLIVCNTISDAKRLYERITASYGSDFVDIVTSDDKDSSRKIEHFKNSLVPWIISINMISEGVDIDRIRCIVYASNVTTQVRFVQVMGRGVRNPKHFVNNNDVCYMYIPDYKPLVDRAREIEEEIKHIRKELEEEIKREPGQGETIQLSLEDEVLSATSEDGGNVFSGVVFDVSQDVDATILANKYNVTKDIVLSMWKDILERQGNPSTPEEQPVQVETITEEKEKYKRLIKKMVARIHYDHSLEYSIIHYTLNKKLGRSSSNILTLDELKKKLEFAKQWYEKLTNG